ncbi:unnamed protein product, partial [Mesorhabditis belari]|uniref:Small ribosomal subunit protein uS15 n=1 Tax=Mesorhabditis belari TaxID=2138241 RepID=A0AAF3FCC6_9BILA
MHPHPDTEVVIIGNGPAGLCLSAFLSGVSPFYSPMTPHPDPLLHQRLSENAAESLLDQDLSWAYGWDEMGSSTLRPMTSLYDTLVRPEADLGQLGSCLHWEQNSSKCVDHIVLGETAIGGSWNTYDKKMIAVSFHNWLDLPGFSISDSLRGKLLIPRISAMLYTRYMEKYAQHLGLKKSIRSQTKVISVKKEGSLWRVKAVTTKCGVKWQTFSLTTRRVVMACGKTKQRTLQVEGEGDEKHIVYDMKTLRKKVTKLLAHKSVSTSEKIPTIVVVGDGISSADMVGFCLSQGLKVIHIIKRNEKQLRSTVMSRLSAGHYAEYHSIYRLMTGRESHPLYERKINAQVTKLAEGKAFVSVKDGVENEIGYSLLGVCIGRISEGMGLFDRKYTFNDYTSDEDETLMCVGSFAGDHFVRYLVGGCLDVARTIHKSLKTPISIKDSDQMDLNGLMNIIVLISEMLRIFILALKMVKEQNEDLYVNQQAMGRMHNPGKGMAKSALPYRRSIPTWLKMSSEDVVEHICRLAKKGLRPSQIGVLLRDSHGVAQVRRITGNKIVRILKAKGMAPEIPEDLYHLVKKAVSIRKHLERCRKDRDSKYRLILVESRIHRLARYYKTSKALPPSWRYESSTASTLIG